MADRVDSRVLELREQLEMDLMLLGEEHHQGILRKKEQHATEVRAASISRRAPARAAGKNKFFIKLSSEMGPAGRKTPQSDCGGHAG